MAAEEFIMPDGIGVGSVDDVHENMIAEAPAQLDKVEGSVFWDFTRPAAIAVTEGINFKISEALKCIWPRYTDDSAVLDDHGKSRSLKRKDATNSYATVTFTGVEGTAIPKGYTVTTEATATEEAVEFTTLVGVVIPAEGSIDVSCASEITGVAANVAPNMITVMPNPIDGLNSCNNAEAATGGADIESDDDFRQRIVEYDEKQSESYVGNDTDYKRWAEEVDGVGTVNVIPAKDESGVVTLIITDANESAADEQICNNVYEHIISPSDRSKRLAPINAQLSVVSAEYLTISIGAVVEMSAGYLVEQVKEEFATKLPTLYKQARADGEVKLKDIYALFHGMASLKDYGSVTLNGAEQNIIVSVGLIPVTTVDDLMFIVGEIPESAVSN